MDKTEVTQVYFVPGLGASSKIFENIKLPDNFEPVLLEWITPTEVNESINSYAKRMAERVKNPDAVLIGVSFGGVMVQEMKQFLNPKKVIIISSIKSREEMPFYVNFSKTTKAHKILPNLTKDSLERYQKFALTNWSKRKIDFYKNYITDSDKKYLPWSLNAVVNWSRKHIDPNIIHIHGDNDHIFPIKNINNCITIPNGTHAMILTKAKKINTILANLLKTI